MRLFPAWMIVKSLFSDELRGTAIDVLFGSAFDKAMVKMNYYYRRGVDNYLEAAVNYMSLAMKEEAARMGIKLSSEDEGRMIERGGRMLEAFQRTPAFGLLRPKTGLVVIDESIGMYVQPDFYDGDSIYEVKSFNPAKTRYAYYQVRLFQLGYPDSEAVLVGFDGEALDPIIIRINKMDEEDRNGIVRDVAEFGSSNGIEGEPNRDILAKYSTGRG